MEQAHDKRRKRLRHWSLIVIHHTGIGKRKTASEKWFQRFFKSMKSWLSRKDQYYVSTHYLIGRRGELTCLVDPDGFEAFHAGRSQWWDFKRRGFFKDCNAFSIGIELIGDGNKMKFSESQYKCLAELIKRLSNRYDIPLNFVVGHEMISPGRKFDPGEKFDWKKLYSLLA